jgi:predicted dehydrogenase
MSKLLVVLVGTAYWAGMHAAAYSRCTEIELVGICGHRDVGRLNKLADQYEIRERSTDLPALLAKTQPDILDVACNPSYRLEGVQAGMVPSVKLINLEKPMALTPEAAYAIERLCLDNGKLLTVNHQKKFLPGWREAKAAISAGAIGEIDFMRATCQGNLLEQGTHLVDMVLFYNDYHPVKWVMGQIDELEGLDKISAGAPDAAVALVCFDNDVRATMTFGSIGHGIPGAANKWMQFSVEVYGTRGLIKVTLNNGWQLTTYEDGRTVIGVSNWDKHFPEALAAHLDAAARYARDPTQGHISDLCSSMASFQAVMAIYASACGGGRTALPQRFTNEVVSELQQRRIAGRAKG